MLDLFSVSNLHSEYFEINFFTTKKTNSHKKCEFNIIKIAFDVIQKLNLNINLEVHVSIH